MICSLWKESKFKEVKEIKRDLQPFLEDKWVNFTKRPKFGQNDQILNILEYSTHSECDFFQRKLHEQLAYQKLGRFMAVFGSYRSTTTPSDGPSQRSTYII